jgi:predicted ABC-type exoprotein transport system permease subunit
MAGEAKMNRTQKTALSSLVIVLLPTAILAFFLFRVFVLKKASAGFAVGFLLLAVLILLEGSLLIWSFKRQSSKEPEADERDKLITNRAAMAAFISGWIALPIVSVIPRFILGDNGCIPAWSLPLINFAALIIIMMVYSIAILIQYGRGGKNGGK